MSIFDFGFGHFNLVLDLASDVLNERVPILTQLLNEFRSLSLSAQFALFADQKEGVEVLRRLIPDFLFISFEKWQSRNLIEPGETALLFTAAFIFQLLGSNVEIVIATIISSVSVLFSDGFTFTSAQIGLDSVSGVIRQEIILCNDESSADNHSKSSLHFDTEVHVEVVVG